MHVFKFGYLIYISSILLIYYCAMFCLTFSCCDCYRKGLLGRTNTNETWVKLHKAL